MFPHWLQQPAKPTRTSRTCAAQRTSLQPRLEVLEDRCLLATRIWDGGATSNNWTNANNWAGNVAPMAGDDLVFPAGISDRTADNNYADGTNFNSITFNGAGYNLRGNRIFLGMGGIIDNSGSSNQINNDIDLGAAGGGATPRAFQVNTGSTLFIDGEIRGGGELHKTGGGDLSFRDNNVYTGLTDIKAGRLFIEKDESLGAFNVSSAGTIIRGGATLLINDQVPLSVIRTDEPITIHNGGTIRALNDVELRGNMATVGTATLRHEGSSIERLLVTGQMSGSGGITITTNANGEVWFRGSNTYSGQTTVNGKLRLDNADGNAIYGNLTVTGNGQLQLERSDQIRDNATVSVNDSGVIWTNNRTDTFFQLNMTGGRIGGTFASSGDGNDLQVHEFVATSSATGVAAAINLANVVLLSPTGIAQVMNGPAFNDLILDGFLGHENPDSSWVLTLEGGGTTLMHTLRSNGSITVNHGLLRNHYEGAFIPSVSVTVNAGGEYSGIGRFEHLTVNAGGRVRPGPLSSTGSLYMSGDLVMHPGAILEVTLNGSVAGLGHDLLFIDGNVNISGAILEATLGPNAAVGQNYRIIDNNLGDAILGQMFVPLDSAPFLLASPRGQRLSINYAGGTLGNDLVLTLENTPPMAPGLAIDQTVINEGGTVTVTGHLVDPDPAARLRLLINWGDGTPVRTVRPGRADFSYRHRYQHDGQYVASFVWLDQFGQGNRREFNVTVNNVPPTASLALMQQASRLFATLVVDDPGQDFILATADFGDGTPASDFALGKRRRLAFQHRYAQPGSYALTLTLRDGDGGVTTFTRPITI